MPYALPAAAAVALAGCFAFSWAAHALRDFSRSRLAELCERRGRSDRFGEILRQHETAFIACDAFALLLLFVFLTASAVRLDVLSWRSSQPWPTVIAWSAVLALSALICRLLLPWTLARVAGEPFLYRIWPAVRIVALLTSPLTFLARRLDCLSHRVAGLPEPGTGAAASISEEILSVVDEGQREGVLEAEAGTMIQRVIELRDEDIGAVMTPRTEMITIRADATIEDARRKFIEAGHSRIPVVGENADDVVGVLYAKDLLARLDGDGTRDLPVRDIAREPLYVPVTSGADTVLETMKRERVHLAIVVDEYGGVAGLVTLEDVIEEIVGDIVDEYDPAEETGVVRLGPDSFEAEGWVHLDDLNEQFSLDLPEEEDFDTLAGFVVNELARVPEPGERFTWRNLRLTVTDADRRKVNRVRVEILEPQSSTAPAPH